jgi:hypothetical protein
MVTIATRASWGARHRDGDITLTGLATKVVIHHTVTAQLPATATVAQEQAQMRLLEQIGQNRFGAGISYNVVVFPSGRAYQGVSFNRRGTHTGGRNSTARSIAFAGNYDTHQPTAAAIMTARQIVAHGRGRWWATNAPVRGHHHFLATACPGRNLRGRLTEIATTPPATPAVTPPAAPPTAPTVPTVLRKGATGPRVAALQTGLNRVFPTYQTTNRVRAAGGGGRPLTVDGRFGPITAAWVAEFQARVGLIPDGIVGPQTGAALARHGITGHGW